MKKFLLIGSSIIVILGVGLVVLPTLIPSSVYKEKIESQLTRELGRDVRVLGEVKLSVFPLIRANTGRVEIDNPQGFSAPQFASMDSMSARVKLFPLFSKRIEIASFTLKSPSINLEKSADGAVNWAFDNGTEKPVQAPSEGPFKRDGRYANIDPSIGKFILQNGQISYVDNVAGTRQNLEKVNIDFVLKSLADPLKVKGDLVYNGMGAGVDLSVNSLRDFLDGRETGIAAKLKTDFATLDTKGRFLASQDIVVNLDLNANIKDAQKLLTLAPSDIKYADILRSAVLSGNYNFDGKTLSAKGANISAKGQSFDAEFTGDAALTETPVLSGKVTFNANDVSSLAKSIEIDIAGLDLINSVNLTADLSAKDKGFRGESVVANVKGEGIDANFSGSVDFAQAVTAKGRFTAKAASVASIIKALEVDMPQAGAVQRITASGMVDYSEAKTSLTNLDVLTSGGLLTGNFKGDAIVTDAIGLKGDFTAEAASVPALVKMLELDLPQAGAVELISVSGAVDYSELKTSLTNLDVNTTGGPLTGSYKGSAVVAETVGFSGNFTAGLNSLPALSARTGIEIPYASAIGVIDISGSVAGQGETLKLSGLSAALKDGLINGNYSGTASLDSGLNLDGRLSAEIPSLRKLAESTGNNSLPPSTQAGNIYERFSISGLVKGTPETITFSDADIKVDAINAKGNFIVDIAQSKPFVTATLALDGLNLNPYMAAYSAQNPTGKIQPWSQEPLNFAALNSVNGDFNLTTPNIITGRIAMGQSDINAKLRAGILTADLPNMALYGGSGRVAAQVNAAGATPSVTFDMGLNNLGAQGFLSAVAGFTNATGATGTSLKFSGQGRTQAEIMKSLSGQGDFKIVDGKISGVDLQALMSGLDQAFASKTLPGGIGASQVTQFKDIVGLFEIEKGVASINKFSLQGLGVMAEGSGALDLGAQKIDFNLRPRLTGKSASDLASFGIPIRVQGGFGDVKVGLDTEMVAKIAAERARLKAGELIEKEVGGALGGILGGVVGGQKAPAEAAPNEAPVSPETSVGAPQSPATVPAPATPQDALKNQAEQKAEEAVKGLIGGIFGSKKPQPAPTPKPEENTEKPVDE